MRIKGYNVHSVVSLFITHTQTFLALGYVWEEREKSQERKGRGRTWQRELTSKSDGLAPILHSPAS